MNRETIKLILVDQGFKTSSDFKTDEIKTYVYNGVEAVLRAREEEILKSVYDYLYHIDNDTVSEHIKAGILDAIRTY